MSERERFSISSDELKDWKRESGLPTSARYSQLFLAQLYIGERIRQLDTYSVISEVRHLEGLKHSTATKSPTAFRRKPLAGFMHKHYYQTEFLASNLASEFGAPRGGNRRLDKLIASLFSQCAAVVPDLGNLLAHESTFGAYERRSARGAATGEWIVYAEHGSIRYYLTLGSLLSQSPPERDL